MKKNPRELAEEHFNNYVGPMQKALLSIMIQAVMATSRFHYVTSHVHGAKHQEEAMINRMTKEGLKTLKKNKKSHKK